MISAIRIYCKAGVFLGMVIGLFLSLVLGVHTLFPDALLFAFYHVVLFAVPLVLLGVVLHLFLTAVGGAVQAIGRESIVAIHRFLSAGIVTGTLTCLLILETQRPYLITWKSASVLGVSSLLSAAFGGIVSLGLARRRAKREGERKRSLAYRIARTAGLYAVAFVIFFLLTRPYHPAPAANATVEPSTDECYRVMLMGIDGATWRVMDRMMAEGKLPNIQRLVSHGVRADLLSEVSWLTPVGNISSMGMRSATVWTSIATGKTALKHGINDFILSEVAGMSEPVTARLPTWIYTKKWIRKFGVNPVVQRRITPAHIKAVTVWDILSEEGLSVGVLGWWLLDVNTPVNGYKISDGFYSGDSFVYPPALLDDEALMGCIPSRDSLPDIRAFTQFEYDPEYEKHFGRSEREFQWHSFLRVLMGDFKRDTFIASAGLLMKKSWPVDFYALYFIGPDNVEHLFWKFMEPEYFDDVTERDVDRFGNVIESYYSFIDGRIGELDSLRDDRTVMILCSDHGMGPWPGARGSRFSAILNVAHQANSGNHRREGMLVMEGGPVRKGVTIPEASVHDIVPTVLHLMGLPAAKDMDGSVITQAFEEGFLQRRPVRTIPTYQYLKKTVIPPAGASEEGESEYMERLKALGYIEE